MKAVHRLLVAVVIVGAVTLPAASARSASETPRRILFLAIAGHGTVTSVPRGISCPKKCRVFFAKDALVRLVSHPAPGWVLARWSGSCAGNGSTCTFNLTSSHDCPGPVCTIGAFGVRVTFARTADQARKT